MADLYTKNGDKGQTSLAGGTVISKADLRAECLGTIDEACSMLGLARSFPCLEYVGTTVYEIQERLFSLGAELASEPARVSGMKDLISENDVSFLEHVADTCMASAGETSRFVIPGVDPASSALHVARTIVRRAERRLVELSQSRPVRGVLISYTNRLSDAVYAMARLQEEHVERRRPEEKRQSVPDGR